MKENININKLVKPVLILNILILFFTVISILIEIELITILIGIAFWVTGIWSGILLVKIVNAEKEKK